MNRVRSELNIKKGFDVNDLISAFELKSPLDDAVRYIIRYSQHKGTKAGQRNLKRAIDCLNTETIFMKNKPEA